MHQVQTKTLLSQLMFSIIFLIKASMQKAHNMVMKSLKIQMLITSESVTNAILKDLTQDVLFSLMKKSLWLVFGVNLRFT